MGQNWTGGDQRRMHSEVPCGCCPLLSKAAASLLGGLAVTLQEGHAVTEPQRLGELHLADGEHVRAHACSPRVPQPHATS